MTDAATLTRAHIRLRDERARLKRSWEMQDAELKQKQARVEAEMLRLLGATNAESLRTEAGTMYRQVDITPTGADWDAFYRWVAAQNAFEALERRIKKQFITQYMEDNNGALPPGVSVFKQYVARVRRA